MFAIFAHLLYQYLVTLPLALITLAILRDIDSISYLHSTGMTVPHACFKQSFSSWILLGCIRHSLLFTMPQIFSIGLRSGEFDGQLNTLNPWSCNHLIVACDDVEKRCLAWRRSIYLQKVHLPCRNHEMFEYIDVHITIHGALSQTHDPKQEEDILSDTMTTCLKLALWFR